MDKYTIYCTEEQIKKALKLDAPIIVIPEEYKEDVIHFQMYLDGENVSVKIPTAEQMTGWLDEQGLLIVIDKNDNYYTWEVYRNIYLIDMSKTKSIVSRKEALLSAIDVALEYLSNNKK